MSPPAAAGAAGYSIGANAFKMRATKFAPLKSHLGFPGEHVTEELATVNYPCNLLICSNYICDMAGHEMDQFRSLRLA
jgi:hypothetical protein